MPDDLFDYFNKKSTRKFEPIDDPDFNSFEDEPEKELDESIAETAPTQGQPVTGQPVAGQPMQTETISAASEPTETAPLTSQAQQPEPETTTASKSESHWDFLASMLGIKTRSKETPEPTDSFPSSDAATQTPSQSLETKLQPTSQADVGLKDIADSSSAEVEPTSPLAEMFRPGDLPPALDLFERETSQPHPTEEIFATNDLDDSTDEDDQFVEDDQFIEDELEFLEFEIEELDSVGSRGQERHQPRRKRRPESASFSNDSQSQSSAAKPEAAKESDARTTGQRSKQRRSGSARSADDRQRRRPESDRAEEIQPRSAEKSERSTEFGAGLFDDAVDDFHVESLTEEQSPAKSSRRRRRRRGGRGDRVSEEVEETKSFDSKIENDPPDEFFDEIGWDPNPSARSNSNRTTSDLEVSDDIADDYDVEELDSDSSDLDQGKRRRRRRGTRSQRKTEKETESSESQQKVESSGAGLDEESTGKKAKFPTWEEAISGLIQSNIKNHSRYDRGGGGRPSGGGRRRR